MKWLVSLSLLVWVNASAQEDKTLTLEEAIRIGKENSRFIEVSRARTDAASAKASEARTYLLPTLTLGGAYQRLSEIDPFQVRLPGTPAPITISPVVLNNYSLKATLQQPLFTGFRLMSMLHSSEDLARASEYDHQNTEADLVLNVTAAYWTMYQTLQKKIYADENALRLETDVRNVKNLLHAGLATQNDLLKANVQLSTAKLNQIDAANDVQLSMMSLNNVLGLPLSTRIALTSTPGAGADSIGQSDTTPQEAPVTLQTKALATRPDLLAMQSRVAAAEAAVQAAQGGWWPQVYLAGNYYYSRPNPRILPTRDEFLSTWDVGVQVQVNLWNWGATLFQTEQAEAGLKQNQSQLEQLKENTMLEVERSVLVMQRAREKITVARIGVDQAEENARVTGEKHRSGLATTSDILDAEVALLQARTAFVGALVEFELAKAQLKRATGGTMG